MRILAGLLLLLLGHAHQQLYCSSAVRTRLQLNRCKPIQHIKQQHLKLW
jgi:hypothetical protein